MNTDQISQTIARALHAAGLDTHSGRLGKVSATIRQALEAAGLAKVYAPEPAATQPQPAPATSPASAATPTVTATPTAAPPQAPPRQPRSATAFRAPLPAAQPVTPPAPTPAPTSPTTASPSAKQSSPPADTHLSRHGKAVPAPGRSEFLALSHSNHHASRAFKLFVPATYAGTPMPLIVMLHGCKQNPDDFAAGTRMNELAEQHGFLVAYPAQTMRDNMANCWNWFERAQQVKGGVEPELIAGIVGQIINSHEVDASRVFVAGLSAGAAMAVILGAAYPEVFAGVAVHSGLPLGAAHDVASAFSAMQGAASSSATSRVQPAVPTIVIYGDADQTVAPGNGAAVVAQSLRAYAQSNTPLQAQPRASTAASSLRSSVTTDYLDAEGRARVTECVVHGGKHTWFGGSAQGSYTDAHGPDASAEIVRFFLQPPPLVAVP